MGQSKSKSGSLSESKEHAMTPGRLPVLLGTGRRETGCLPFVYRLCRLGGRGYGVKEAPAVCRSEEVDFDPDFDFDLDQAPAMP